MQHIIDLAVEYCYDYRDKALYLEGLTPEEVAFFNKTVKEIRRAERAEEPHDDTPSLGEPWYAFR